ncbi:MAG: DUF5655 domain-containing protein [Candidatus Odinarchaeota archaeon]
MAVLKPNHLNEEDTRGILIDPMLQALGWNIFDLNEISRNSKTSSGGYIDYILKYNGRQIYVEAKPLSSELTQKFQIQATNYAYEDNITYCVLTNGNRYQIFETFKKGTVSERLLIDISLDDEKVPIEKKIKFLNFISKENIKNGSQECANHVKSLSFQNEAKGTNNLPGLSNLILNLREQILALGKDITEVFYHQHYALGFKRHTEFVVLNIKSKNKEIEVLLRFGEFKPNFERFKGVKIEFLPKTNTCGRINFKVTITKKEQIKEIMGLIKQCYDLQLKWHK